MITFRLLTLILSIIALFQNSVTTVQAQEFVRLSNPEKPGLLVVDHVKGSITITGYDGDVVVVSGEFRKADTGKKLKINTAESNNRVTVTNSTPYRIVDYAIRVPRSFSLNLTTYDNGVITVRNVAGEMEISNANGDIELTGIKGSALVNSIEGNITAMFLEITQDMPMVFTSIEGKVDLTLPKSTRARLKMKSDQGEIFTGFKMNFERQAPQAEKQQESGVYKVTFDDWTYGKINGGGPEIMVKSLFGNIYIREGKE